MSRKLEWTHDRFMKEFEKTDSWLYHNVKVVSECIGYGKPIIMETKYGLISMEASRNH